MGMRYFVRAQMAKYLIASSDTNSYNIRPEEALQLQGAVRIAEASPGHIRWEGVSCRKSGAEHIRRRVSSDRQQNETASLCRWQGV